MEDWKIYALAFFPELRTDLLEDYFSYYHVFFDLHRTLPDLYRSAEPYEALRLRFAYARWCLFHEDADIRNAGMVAWYEHLFDRRENWDYAVRWVDEDEEVMRTCWPIWEYRAKPEDLQDLRELLEIDTRSWDTP